MTENKFKAGDKVRVINADNTSFDVGDIVTLLGFDRSTPPLWECQKEGERYNQWFYLSQLEHIDTSAPAPEIIVGGHTYRLVEPDALEPKEGQIWADDFGDFYMLADEIDNQGYRSAMFVGAKYRGVLSSHRTRHTFIAHSLREALESGKVKVEDL